MWNTRDVFVGKCPSNTGGELKNAHSHETGSVYFEEETKNIRF